LDFESELVFLTDYECPTVYTNDWWARDGGRKPQRPSGGIGGGDGEDVGRVISRPQLEKIFLWFKLKRFETQE